VLEIYFDVFGSVFIFLIDFRPEPGALGPQKACGARPGPWYTNISKLISKIPRNVPGNIPRHITRDIPRNVPRRILLHKALTQRQKSTISSLHKAVTQSF